MIKILIMLDYIEKLSDKEWGYVLLDRRYMVEVVVGFVNRV